LRGAADANHDRRVTLNEAYEFAYNETLQRTETSRAGAQHPAYDIQLAGTGDLVMTDLHTSASRLVLARELAGRIYVRDNAGRLVVELHKEPTYPVELGLEAGTYRVVVTNPYGSAASTARVSVFGAAGRLIPGYSEDWVRTPFYGHEITSQLISAVLFAGLCVYVWRRSLSNKEEAES